MLLHHKIFREDRLLHLALLLSVLRSLPDLLFLNVDPFQPSNPVLDQSLFPSTEQIGGFTRDQVLQHLSQHLLSRLDRDQIRNILNGDFYPDLADLHTFPDDPHSNQFTGHHDLGDMLGQSPWRHTSSRSGYYGTGSGDNFLGNTGEEYSRDVPVKGLDSLIREQESSLIMNRLNVLASGSGNAWLNGILGLDNRPLLLQDSAGESESDLDSESESVSDDSLWDEFTPQKGDDMAMDNRGPPEPRIRDTRNHLFDIHAYVVLGETSVIPNSTSNNNNDAGRLLPLVNPTPPPTPPPPRVDPSSLPPSTVPSSSSTATSSSEDIIILTSPSVDPATPPRSPSAPMEQEHAPPPPAAPPAAREGRSLIGGVGDVISSTTAAFPGVSGPTGVTLSALSTTGLSVHDNLRLPRLITNRPYFDDNLLEDRALLQALWMQDQDMVPWELYEDSLQPMDSMQAAMELDHPTKGALLHTDRPVMMSEGPRPVDTLDDDGGGQPRPDPPPSNVPKYLQPSTVWGHNITLDAETGEYHLLPDSDLDDPKTGYLYSGDEEGTGKGYLPNPYLGHLNYGVSSANASSAGQPNQAAPPRHDIFEEAAAALRDNREVAAVPAPTVAPADAAPNEEIDFVKKILEKFTPQDIYNTVQSIQELELQESSGVTNPTSSVPVSVQQDHLADLQSSLPRTSSPRRGGDTTADRPAASSVVDTTSQVIISCDYDVDELLNDSLTLDFNDPLFEAFEGFPQFDETVVKVDPDSVPEKQPLASARPSSQSNNNGSQSAPAKDSSTSSQRKRQYTKSSETSPGKYSQNHRYKRRRESVLSLDDREHSEEEEEEDFDFLVAATAAAPPGVSRPRLISSSSSTSGRGTLGLNSSFSSPSLASDSAESRSASAASFVSEEDQLNEDLLLPDSEVALPSLGSLNSSLNEMIQASVHQESRAVQGRMGGIIRGGSMDQRWQDLASLLSLPTEASATQHPAPHTPHTPTMTTHHHHHHQHHQAPPPPHLAPPHQAGPPQHPQAPPTIHHPHALYPAHDGGAGSGVSRGVGGLLHNATLPPSMPDPVTHNVAYANSMGASSHLVSSSLNLTNSSSNDHIPDQHHHHHHHQHHPQHHYKMETSSLLPPPPPPPPPAPSHPHDMLYYQSSSGGGELGAATPQQQQHQPPVSGAHQTDGFLSSILGEEDLHLMDMAIGSDYHRASHPSVEGSSSGGMMSPHNSSAGVLSPHTSLAGPSPADYSNNTAYRGWNMTSADLNRLAAPVAQKKHQMYGKRYFQDSTPPPPLHGTGGAGSSHYPGHYPHTPSTAMDTTPAASAHITDPMELKYSCSMDFRGPHEVSPALEHVQHNHTYHMSPDGPSGLPRPAPRDPKSKGRKSEPERSLTRDEKRARALNLPITCDDIIHLPMDEFNERISKYDLTEPQLSLIRDIRRRGKNKVAAQNCRKRKLDQIMHLAEEVKVIQSRKNELISQYDYLSNERVRVKQKFELLYRHIFRHLRDSDGQPYSPHEYNLQQSADGSVLLVPRSSPHMPLDPGLPPHPSTPSTKPDEDAKGHHHHHHNHPHQQH